VVALLASFVGLGVAYAAGPGVVNAEALRRGLREGIRPAVLVELGSLLGDLTWATVGLTGAALLLQARPLRIALGLAAAAFILRLAGKAIIESLCGGRDSGGGAAAARGAFMTGVVFGLANPFGIAFWAGVGGMAGADHGAVPLAVVLPGFFAGAVAWCVGFPCVVAGGRRLVGPGATRWIGLGAGLVLAGFGGRVLWLSLEDAWAAVRPRGQ
jgi:threonine/homoserine/homoserine lactone efflux protein